jgi:hypothetical protein
MLELRLAGKTDGIIQRVEHAHQDWDLNGLLGRLVPKRSETNSLAAVPRRSYGSRL